MGWVKSETPGRAGLNVPRGERWSYAMATGKLQGDSTSLLLKLSEILSENAYQLEQIATGASNTEDQTRGVSDPGGKVVRGE